MRWPPFLLEGEGGKGGGGRYTFFFVLAWSDLRAPLGIFASLGLFERYEVVGRPDFVADPVDLMEKPLRDKIFERAGTRDRTLPRGTRARRRRLSGARDWL